MRVFAAVVAWAVVSADARARDAVWQWSVPVESGRAYLWIHERCERVSAVVLAQHNMIEYGILQDASFRETLGDIGAAAVFIVPSIDAVFRFDEEAGERFERVLRELSEVSGYTEVATVPVVPMGHSAHASFPWNFAAWAADRTLAVLSLKGDAPLTDLTGSGRPNPDWGERTIEGVPGLMVMSEQEWWEARLVPLVRYRSARPAAPIAVFADTGHGHFDATPPLIDFLALFLRKAAEARLPRLGSTKLRTVEPSRGWLVDRWRGDEPPRAAAAPHDDYVGDRSEAFWCFDEETARAIEERYAASRGKAAQQVSFVQHGALVPIANTHGGIELEIRPEPDGLTFRLDADFITPLPPPPRVATKNERPEPAIVQPTRAPSGTHAAGRVRVSVIVGPVDELAPSTFRVALDRMFSPTDPRASEVWLLAHHSGDATYRSAVQQARLRLPRYVEGREQTLDFPKIADRRADAGPLRLAAASDAGLPVGFFVREGPAVVRDGVLNLTALPPRSRLPMAVTVVAWQWGRGAEPAVRAARSVEQTFWVVP
jgi:hypothetical protein